MLMSPFFVFFNSAGNLMQEPPDKGLKVEMLMYWESVDSIIQPDTSLIQFSILYKISWKALSRLTLSFITFFVVIWNRLEKT